MRLHHPALKSKIKINNMYSELQQIYWYSGLYLQPQHLQSLDLHHNYMLARHRQLAQPYNFGFIQCEINEETLLDFTLRIDRLQAILPSGEYLEYPGNSMLQPRQFRELWRQFEKPFTLWLALRRFNPGHINVGDTPNSRWIKPSEDGVMKDLYFNGPECNVSRIIYNVRIVSDDEKEKVVDCEFLPLIRLLYDNDRVIIDSTFCPPIVTLNGYSSLKRNIDGLCAALSNRAHQFAEYKRAELFSDASNRDLTQFLLMRILNHSLPLLNHFCNAANIHPWHIYGLLTQVIGELSCFSEQCSFNGEWDGNAMLLAYDHFNLYECFDNARKLIIDLLDNVAIENNSWITLSIDSQRIFRGSLQLVSWEQSGSILLMLRSANLPPVECINSDNFKISAGTSINTLIQHSLTGISAKLLNPTPRGIPNRPDTIYYDLDIKSDLWLLIKQHQNIAFYWDDSPADLLVQVIFMGV